MFYVFYFTVQHVYQLCPQEHVLSICTCNLLSDDADEANAANDGRQVFVVGTALVRPEDKEPSFGRILVFQVIGGTVHVYCNEYINTRTSCIACTTCQQRYYVHVHVLVLDSSCVFISVKNSVNLSMHNYIYTSVA